MPPILSLQIERTEVGVREHNRIMRATMFAVAYKHWKETIPKHFENNPSTRPGGPYGYRKRSKRWEKLKDRKGGANKRPNYFTGALFNTVMSGSRITATPSKATLHLRVGFQMPAWQRRELEAITPGELRTYIQTAHRLYQDEVDQSDKKLKRRITV